MRNYWRVIAAVAGGGGGGGNVSWCPGLFATPRTSQNVTLQNNRTTLRHAREQMDKIGVNCLSRKT